MAETVLNKAWSTRRECGKYGTALLTAGELPDIPESEQRFNREELTNVLTGVSYRHTVTAVPSEARLEKTGFALRLKSGCRVAMGTACATHCSQRHAWVLDPRHGVGRVAQSRKGPKRGPEPVLM